MFLQRRGPHLHGDWSLGGRCRGEEGDCAGGRPLYPGTVGGSDQRLTLFHRGRTVTFAPQQIRASRKGSPGGGSTSGIPGSNTPGHITAYVRVPLRVVGLVVGPKGATIKRIQQDTHTYIITPSREREPIFEVRY